MKIALIRQRPSIGDCLLLAPLIRAIKERHPNSRLTVITDSSYIGGALPRIFEGIPGVDRIECVASTEWTTEGNKVIDPILRTANGDTPHAVKKADLVYDCNSAFMEFERQYHGKTPCGIGEFWLRYHKYDTPTSNVLPVYQVSPEQEEAVSRWFEEFNIPTDKKLVGMVLRSGAACRDWDYNGKCASVAMWIHSANCYPIGIDPWKGLPSPYGCSCVGKPLDFVAALLKRCDAVLTPDTGLLHLAQAVGTPTVALWGILSPELRVKGYNTLVVPNTSLGVCSDNEAPYCPCCRWTFQQWSCMRRITLPMITEALAKTLKK
jgi:hypothetical protein